MELVSVLPSENVEINVACFHPVAGGGLAYGTNVCVWFLGCPNFCFLLEQCCIYIIHYSLCLQVGKLRILKYDCDFAAHMTRLDHFFEAQRVDVDL